MTATTVARGVHVRVRALQVWGAAFCGSCLGLCAGMALYWTCAGPVAWEAWPIAVGPESAQHVVHEVVRLARHRSASPGYGTAGFIVETSSSGMNGESVRRPGHR